MHNRQPDMLQLQNQYAFFGEKDLRSIGRRNAEAIGLINLIDNLARYEQIARLKLRPRIAD